MRWRASKLKDAVGTSILKPFGNRRNGKAVGVSGKKNVERKRCSLTCSSNPLCAVATSNPASPRYCEAFSADEDHHPQQDFGPAQRVPDHVEVAELLVITELQRSPAPIANPCRPIKQDYSTLDFQLICSPPFRSFQADWQTSRQLRSFVGNLRRDLMLRLL